MEIRALRPDDDRSGFSCGDSDLDRFFVRYAGQNQFRHQIGTTYVAAEGAAIAGFATVSAGGIEIDRLPATTRKKLPRYPLPVLRLARLGVDARTQGRGVGGELLAFVCGLASRMGEEVGCVGVLVDAKPGAVDFYARYGFVALDALQGQSAARPEPALMFLPTTAIRHALR